MSIQHWLACGTTAVALALPLSTVAKKIYDPGASDTDCRRTNKLQI